MPVKFSFQLRKPGNMTATIGKVKKVIEEHKCEFSGNEQGGTIIAKSFETEGSYTVKSNEIHIDIMKSNFPNFLVKMVVSSIFKSCMVD
jgi:hypothetical protein